MKNKFFLRQAQELGAKLAKAQEELDNAVVEVSSGGGAVRITMTGQQKIQSVSISPEVIDPEEAGLLEDLVMVAVNEAVEKSQELARSHLEGLTGGLKLPGMP